MKIYTKQGDQGKTSLVDGTRIEKSHLRLDAYGTVDELNSHLGLLTHSLSHESVLTEIVKEIQEIQKYLFQLGSQLACVDSQMAAQLPSIKEREVESLEKQMDQWDEELPPLKNFILPGGHLGACQAHVCRTLSRRVERILVKLELEKNLPPLALPFLNRLSDYFFVLARVINHRTSHTSLEWKP